MKRSVIKRIKRISEIIVVSEFTWITIREIVLSQQRKERERERGGSNNKLKKVYKNILNNKSYRKKERARHVSDLTASFSENKASLCIPVGGPTAGMKNRYSKPYREKPKGRGGRGDVNKKKKGE